jgi:hypothetical protein
MPSDKSLMASIARQVRSGELPDGDLSKMYAGCGDEDAVCDVCGFAIGPGQVLYEIIVDGHGEERTMTAHLRCHDLWRQALREAH